MRPCALLTLFASSLVTAQDDWYTEDVTFENAGAVLAGTLFIPRADPPLAAVVLIHGSGPEERIRWFAPLLASDGFAVLTYDKRGVGMSGGVYEGENNVSTENLSLLASDAAAAFASIREHPLLVDIPGGFAGFSQAGWIAPLAALQAPSADFIALWSGVVSTVDEELRFSALAQSSPSSLEDYSSREFEEFLGTVRYRPDDFDPRQSLSQLSVAGLWIFGGEDTSVPVDLSIARLEELIRQGHRFEYELFPDRGHFDFTGQGDPLYQAMRSWMTDVASRLR